MVLQHLALAGGQQFAALRDLAGQAQDELVGSLGTVLIDDVDDEAEVVGLGLGLVAGQRGGQQAGGGEALQLGDGVLACRAAFVQRGGGVVAALLGFGTGFAGAAADLVLAPELLLAGLFGAARFGQALAHGFDLGADGLLQGLPLDARFLVQRFALGGLLGSTAGVGVGFLLAFAPGVFGHGFVQFARGVAPALLGLLLGGVELGKGLPQRGGGIGQRLQALGDFPQAPLTGGGAGGVADELGAGLGPRAGQRYSAAFSVLTWRKSSASATERAVMGPGPASGAGPCGQRGRLPGTCGANHRRWRRRGPPARRAPTPSRSGSSPPH